MAKASKVVVKQEPGNEVPTELIAHCILVIAEGVRKLRSGRLNDRALHLLIQHAAPESVSIRDIKAVFAGIEALEATYLRKPRTSAIAD